MKAKVTTAFPGRPDSEVMTRTIAVDEVIDGDLAAVAVKEGWAEEVADEAAGDSVEADASAPKKGSKKG